MQPAVRDSLSSTAHVNNDHSPPRPHAPAEHDNRIVRSIPPWVHVEDDDGDGDGDDDDHYDPTTQTRRLLPPPSAVPATHHYIPTPPTQHKAPGRKWDHLRNAEPAMLDQPIEAAQARWHPYMLSGPHPRADEDSHIVDDEWMDENMPHMTARWTSPESEEPSEKPSGFWLLSPARQKSTLGKIQRIILKNPYVPLVFRLTVLSFSCAALGLGARVYHEADQVASNTGNECNKRASTYMAIILDSIAVPYICYITWDEYLSKPLGLRSATAKVSLLLVDLYFIVFYSSNLTLAFDSLYDDRWACYDEAVTYSNCPNSTAICRSQKGLAGVLVVALVAWLFTFMISVLRVVERLR